MWSLYLLSGQDSAPLLLLSLLQGTNSSLGLDPQGPGAHLSLASLGTKQSVCSVLPGVVFNQQAENHSKLIRNADLQAPP